jgi:peptidyl-tRNA hydrolase, PTH1 family
MYYIIGLGNPGEEYQKTRHNVGWLFCDALQKKYEFDDWKEDSKKKVLTAKGSIGKEKVTLVKPNNFMNNSGGSVVHFVTSEKKALKAMVVYDDLDVGIGDIKASFNKSSGGHRGVESVIKKIKTKSFYRLRFGISSINAKGMPKKPKGEEKVLKYIMREFPDKEMLLLKKAFKKAILGVELWVADKNKGKGVQVLNS